MESDHFDGRRFFNPRGANGQPVSALPRLVAAPRARWPSHVAVTPQRPPPLEDSAAIVTFIGHSSFLIQTRYGNVLTDPVYSERASPLTFIGPRRVRAPGVRFADLPPISVVLLSHNHYDHCDLRTLRALDRRSSLVVIAPLGNRRLLMSAGVAHVEELDWWQEATRAPFAVTLTPAQHFSARTPFDRNRALWGGFVLTIGHQRIFFAGDSGYAPHFRELRGRLGPMALALLPIGAYEPRWFMKDIHMNPEEAVQAHLDLAAARSIGMHFGTFQLTPEGIDEPLRELAAARLALGVAETAFVTLDNGGSLRLGAGWGLGSGTAQPKPR
jgi:L-ascorbate metabolism protein UlaG (beta-lactamase superfamily)